MLDDKALDTIFRAARTHNVWLDRPVTDAQLRALYDILKWGPTSANCQPMRVVFVRSKEAKDKLAPALGPNNVEKTMKAPVTAIIAHDSRFYEHLPRMFAHNQTARSWFEGPDKKAVAEATAFRNGTLQGAYFIIAARALGLDCGPMSGFDSAKVDAAFFPDGRYRSNFLVNVGYGDPAKVMPRNPRFDFDEACRIV
jgi:3-hydroxypropanoate dehydrogenase